MWISQQTKTRLGDNAAAAASTTASLGVDGSGGCELGIGGLSEGDGV